MVLILTYSNQVTGLFHIIPLVIRWRVGPKPPPPNLTQIQERDLEEGRGELEGLFELSLMNRSGIKNGDIRTGERPHINSQAGPWGHEGDLVALDKGFGHVAADVIFKLLGRGLEEIGGRADNRAAQAAIQRQLGAAHGVNDDTSGVGAVPNLELGFQVEGDIPKGGAFHADVAPLAIGQPRDIIRGANVNVVLADIVGDHAGDCAGLGDFFAFQPFALEHVHKVGVAAEVKLVGAVNADAAINEKAGQNTVQDGGANLALDVIAQDGQAGFFEALSPIF